LKSRIFARTYAHAFERASKEAVLPEKGQLSQAGLLYLIPSSRERSD
jgi:hypothetical protein